MKIREEDALNYHSKGRPGKIEVVPTTATKTQRDLSLAYSPGVAIPVLKIAEDSSNAYKYTAKGNLVGVITNGTAILGLGNKGPLASKPVMEGKGILFKIYADIDVFDIELDSTDVEHFVSIVKAMEPTFGGINLEDIAAPEAFVIEERLKEEMNIPVMHDDQHGTAIISGAALLNALELANKKIEEVKVVVSGAGAAAISCMKMWLSLGVQLQNVFMFDVDGLVSTERKNLDPYKAKFVSEPIYNNIADALVDADVLLGLSVGNVVTAEMVISMANQPIVFALANPNPEISYDIAKAARPDAIVATGRSDFPNQVNNVLGFPYIFRGALDCRATGINEAMKLAAAKAIAALAKEPVPEIVNIAYGKKSIVFGPEYIIPKPVDPRLLETIAPAVAKAAIDSGIAKINIENWEAYKIELNKRLGLHNQVQRVIFNKARRDPKKVVFAEADDIKVLKAAQIVKDEGTAQPILVGKKEVILSLIDEYNLDLTDATLIDTYSETTAEKRKEYGQWLYEKRKRKGLTLVRAEKLMLQRNYFACMMVETGECDAMISGQTSSYPDTIRPALQIIGTRDDVTRVAGMYIMVTKRGPIFFADTTVNFDPTEDELVDIVLLAAQEVSNYNVTPKIAMLAYSNFGSVNDALSNKVSNAVKKIKSRMPHLIIDGEMQANLALNNSLLKKEYPFSELVDKEVNTLIFPNLASGNIAYKLISSLGVAEPIGPILMGLKKPVHVLQRGSSIREIVNMATIAVVNAQRIINQQQNEIS